MHTSDDYEVPTANKPPVRSSSKNVWRDGLSLVIRRDIEPELEPRCLVTGKPEQNYEEHRFMLEPDWLKSFVFKYLFGVIGYWVAATFFAESVPVSIPVDPKLYRERRRAKFLSRAMVLGGIFGMLVIMVIYLFTSVGEGLLAASTFPLLISFYGLWYGYTKAKPLLAIERYGEQLVWISGVNYDVLSALPQFPRTPPNQRAQR
jgi:hypothetical protein